LDDAKSVDTYLDSCSVEAHRALPDPVGSIPMGVLMARSQSCLSISPFTTCTGNREKKLQSQHLHRSSQVGLYSFYLWFHFSASFHHYRLKVGWTCWCNWQRLH